MKKSPALSADNYRIGTKKQGLEDYYYVLFDKNKKKRWRKQGCLFVIYKINIDAKTTNWTYNKFPSDWKWVGGGATVPIGYSQPIKYPQEEQFMGNPNYTTKMKKILKRFYDNLKSKNIIQHYKIVSKKGLQKYMPSI